MANKLSRITVWFILVLFVAGFVSFLYLYLNDYFSLSLIKKYHGLLIDYKNNHYFLFLLIYIVAYIVMIAFAVPDLIFITILGGYFFGANAIIYTIFSLTVGECLLFYMVNNAINLSLTQKTHKWIKTYEDKFKNNAFQYILFLKLIPIFPPFWLIDALAASLNVRFSVFFAATFIGTIPTCFVYVLTGNSISLLIDNNQAYHLSAIYQPFFILPWVVIVLYLILSFFYSKKTNLKG